YSYERLLNSVDVANQQELVTAENIILQAANAYFNILRAKANMEAVEASLNASIRRYEYAEANYELSGGSSLEMLSAKVDLNQDSTLYLNAEASYLESIYTLNQLMGVEVNSTYSFKEIRDKRRDLMLNPLLDDAFAQNSQLQNNRILEEQSILNYRIAKSAYLPRLNLNSSYSYSSSNTEGSFLVLNQSNGLSSSLVLSIPIFTGGVNNSNLESAEINKLSATERSLEIKSQLERDVRSAYTNYLNALKIKDMEQRNISSAEQNFNYTKELYEQGLASSVLFREAQINLLLARNSLANARYNAVLAELELLRLSGNLIPALNGE
ncbi:TolC family protein, partial [bacterium]|nr:TolC family protein [bacterium]